MEILEKWLRPLYEEHVRKREKDTLAEAQRKAEAECEEMERRRRERKDKERKEMSEFRVQPLVVIDRYEHNNLKLLKHAVSCPLDLLKRWRGGRQGQRHGGLGLPLRFIAFKKFPEFAEAYGLQTIYFL